LHARTTDSRARECLDFEGTLHETIEALIHPKDRDIYEDESFYCVEKSWHGIHYLLNGEAWTGEPPLDFIVAGGHEVGDIDVGYGPARVFSSDELAAIIRALGPITDDMLRARFKPVPADQEHIYPFYGGLEVENVEALIDAYHGLRGFLELGAGKGLGCRASTSSTGRGFDEA
jgi:hypothetical protein